MRSVGKERTSGLHRQTVQSGEELSGPLSLKGVSLMVVPGVHTCLGQCCLMISSGTFNMSRLWMTPKQKEQLVHKVGRGVVQRDLDKQQEWGMNIKKFYKDKCKVLHLGQSNPCMAMQAGDQLIRWQLCRTGSVGSTDSKCTWLSGIPLNQ